MPYSYPIRFLLLSLCLCTTVRSSLSVMCFSPFLTTLGAIHLPPNSTHVSHLLHPLKCSTHWLSQGHFQSSHSIDSSQLRDGLPVASPGCSSQSRLVCSSWRQSEPKQSKCVSCKLRRLWKSGTPHASAQPAHATAKMKLLYSYNMFNSSLSRSVFGRRKLNVEWIHSFTPRGSVVLFCQPTRIELIVLCRVVVSVLLSCRLFAEICAGTFLHFVGFASSAWRWSLQYVFLSASVAFITAAPTVSAKNRFQRTSGGM